MQKNHKFEADWEGGDTSEKPEIRKIPSIYGGGNKIRRG